MKRIPILLSLLSCWTHVFSQSRPVELSDLVKSLLPDSSGTTALVKWNHPGIFQKQVAWQNSVPAKKEDIFYMRGSIPLAINGETFSCEVGQTSPCPYQVYLQGNEDGYARISLDHLSSPGCKPKQLIGDLFSNLVRSKLLRSSPDTGQIRVYTFEFRMPGKKTAWLKYAIMQSEMGNSIYLKIYFTEKDLKADEQVKPETDKVAKPR